MRWLPYVGSPSGVPAAFLQGFLDSWRSFECVLPCLPQSIHAFAVTQRGHGDADRSRLRLLPLGPGVEITRPEAPDTPPLARVLARRFDGHSPSGLRVVARSHGVWSARSFGATTRIWNCLVRLLLGPARGQ
jgi:pimeloyl-ACP methyl ester carboxylesterase